MRLLQQSLAAGKAAALQGHVWSLPASALHASAWTLLCIAVFDGCSTCFCGVQVACCGLIHQHGYLLLRQCMLVDDAGWLQAAHVDDDEDYDYDEDAGAEGGGGEY